MNYSQFRLLLIEQEYPPLLKEMKEALPSREQHLERSFSKNFEFKAGRSFYNYVYIGRRDKILLGRVGRKSSETVNLPPEKHFDEEDQERWHAANFLLDISPNEGEGQKAMVEEVNKLGAPITILSGMAKHFNEEPDSRWKIEVNTISYEQDFWDVVSEYRGKISKIELTFVPPNLFGGKTKLEGSLKELQGNYFAEEVSFSMQNSKGELQPDSPQMRECSEFIAEGGGRSKVKAEGRTVFDSRNKIQKIEIKDEDNVLLNESNKNHWMRLIRKLFFFEEDD